MRRLRSVRDDDGAAVVDFVLISIMLTTVVLALVQLCIVLYVRNVLVSSAAEGARYGANKDLTATDAVARTERLVSGGITGSVKPVVSGDTHLDETIGAQVVEVRVSAVLPLVGFLGPAQTLTVTGHALKEGQ